MNYTENYHLPQWDETDRVLRTDFNQMCAGIEAGLLKTAADAAAGNAKTASDAKADTQNAQATADKAVADAAKAQAKADAAYSPSQPPYVVGSYKGTSAETTINLGFRPRFLIVSGGVEYTMFCAAGTDAARGHLVFTSTGFTVKPVYSDGVGGMQGPETTPLLTSSGRTYTYIAFR